jgi:hypothetical protein
MLSRTIYFLFVLTLVLSAEVFSEQIKDHYKVSKYFPGNHLLTLHSPLLKNNLEAEQVCTEDDVIGARAKVYCRGRILEAVMSFNLFNDSKTFVGEFLSKSKLNY